jgi:hypothetical protein
LQILRTQELVSESALVARAAKMLVTARALKTNKLHTSNAGKMVRSSSCSRGFTAEPQDTRIGILGVWLARRGIDVQSRDSELEILAARPLQA